MKSLSTLVGILAFTVSGYTHASEALKAVLEAQSDETKARYEWRHPEQTLNFFDIQPGQVVMEVLPGQVWYGSILLPFLGPQGKLIGVDYDMENFKHFDWATEAFMKARQTWAEDYVNGFKESGLATDETVEAYSFATLPDELTGTVDRALFVRALHNMRSQEEKGAYLSRGLAETFRLLKSGGLVGVVQHRAPADKSDMWANGSRGYLKVAEVKRLFAEAGFEFVKESEINANPKDMPGDEDVVWRLSPSFYTSKEGSAERAAYEAIGESDRMTLVFRKP